MDKTKRQTHDFMNVHSFSQLPFIRPPPIPSKEKAVRLFGIEFNDELNSTETLSNAVDLDSNNRKVNAEESSSSIRRFECHYCCRNFPTSQALGGHQNAHKRERQHAKRAHIHSPSALSEGHVYGYHRFGSTYPTWNNGNANAVNSGGRYYGSSYSHPQQAINGNPLGLWRFPTATVNVPNSSFFSRERSLRPLTLLTGEETNTRMGPTRVGVVRPSGSQNRYVYDSKRSVNEHVSLDLHL